MHRTPNKTLYMAPHDRLIFRLGKIISNQISDNQNNWSSSHHTICTLTHPITLHAVTNRHIVSYRTPALAGPALRRPDPSAPNTSRSFPTLSFRPFLSLPIPSLPILSPPCPSFPKPYHHHCQFISLALHSDTQKCFLAMRFKPTTFYCKQTHNGTWTGSVGGRVVFCCVLLCSVVFCCVLLCSVVFCCVLLCSVVFCYVLTVESGSTWMNTCTSATCLELKSNGPFGAKIWAAAVGGVRLTVWVTVGRILGGYGTCWMAETFSYWFVIATVRSDMRYTLKCVCAVQRCVSNGTEWHVAHIEQCVCVCVPYSVVLATVRSEMRYTLNSVCVCRTALC
jgi:hypothetical protein